MYKLLLGLFLSIPMLAQIGPQNGTKIENTTVLQDPSGNCRTSDYQRRLTNLLVNPPRDWVCVNINPAINLFGTWIQSNVGGGDGGGASIWGQITGTLSNQTDLFAALTGPISAGQLPAFSGDFTTSTGSTVATFKTVNDTPGVFGSSTQCLTITLNAKGLVTHVVQVACAGGGGSTAGLTFGAGVPTIACDPGAGSFLYQDTANTTPGTNMYNCIAHNTWAHLSYIGPSNGLKNCGISNGDFCMDADSTVLDFLGLPQTETAIKTFQAGKKSAIYSVAGTPLPACISGLETLELWVSDATAPTYGAAYTGSGTVHVPVYCDGTGWKTH